MGRGKGKGKKLSVTSHEDPGSGEEEKIALQKRRGRPQKPLKDEIDQEEAKRVDHVEEDMENINSGFSSKEKKRKRSSNGKEKPDLVKDENSNGALSSISEPTMNNRFRHIGSRRKNTPRRAAEAVVECN